MVLSVMSTPEVAILGVIVFVGLMANLAVGMAMAFRYKKRELEHRERMIAMERGTPMPAPLINVEPQPWRPTSLLRRGLMWSLSGLGMMIFLFAISMAGPREIPVAGRVQSANTAKMNGASEAQIEQIMNDKQERGLQPQFSLIGLIPIGVGVAYLITYRKEKTVP